MKTKIKNKIRQELSELANIRRGCTLTVSRDTFVFVRQMTKKHGELYPSQYISLLEQDKNLMETILKSKH